MDMLTILWFIFMALSVIFNMVGLQVKNLGATFIGTFLVGIAWGILIVQILQAAGVLEIVFNGATV